jgi:uncharacterized protein YxeA
VAAAKSNDNYKNNNMGIQFQLQNEPVPVAKKWNKIQVWLLCYNSDKEEKHCTYTAMLSLLQQTYQKLASKEKVCVPKHH